jgi:kinesin family protein 5
MLSCTDSIRVVCRFRPLNTRESAISKDFTVDFDDEMTTVKLNEAQFTFDRVFDWSANQRQVFDYSALQIVDDVMKGYNGTIFAYGQTGSGKTYTMMVHIICKVIYF